MKGTVLTGIVSVSERGKGLSQDFLKNDTAQVLERAPAELVEFVVRPGH
jgi:hypothetical protein